MDFITISLSPFRCLQLFPGSSFWKSLSLRFQCYKNIPYVCLWLLLNQTKLNKVSWELLYFYLLHIFLLLFAKYIMYVTYLLHIASFISCIQLAIVPLKIMLFICYIYFFIYFFFIYFFFDLLHIFVHKMEWKIPFLTLYHVWMNLCSELK